MGQPAKVLAPADVRLLMASVSCGRHAARNRVMIPLSSKAGLRVCEIAALSSDMVCQADGWIGRTVTIPGATAKNGRGRQLPMHGELCAALERLHAEYDWVSAEPVFVRCAAQI